MSVQLDNDVLLALSQASVEGNVLRLEGQLDRKLYLRVNKVLEGLGAKWNRKLGGHSFDVPDLRERLEGVVATGVFVDPKKVFQFFQTPEAVVRRMVELVQPGDWSLTPLADMTILEPSAGRGAIIRRLMELGTNTSFLAYEAMEENRRALADLPTTKILGDDFMLDDQSRIVDQILEATDGRGIDACLMNPPFANQADISHVTQAIDVIHKLPGSGVPLVSVMSAGTKFRNNAKTTRFRDWLVDVDLKHQILDLPDGAFVESGTNVRTVLLKVTV